MRRILAIAGWILLTLSVILLGLAAWNWDTIQRVFLGGLKDYETVAPKVPAKIERPAILVFSKTNGYRHEEAIGAANTLFAELARKNGWGYFQTESGAVFTPEILSRFDAVVFSNVSGDVFTSDQKAAFRNFIENGGGYVGLHAAGDSSHRDWRWYTDTLIGADFTQHTMAPQFQQAKVSVEDPSHPATMALPASWMRTEEWYSFDKSPRTRGFHVLATVDESTYTPEGLFGKDLRMGKDHPAVWSRCVGGDKGRQGHVLYTIFGHRAEAFAEPEVRNMLEGAIAWAVRQRGKGCDGGYLP